MTTPDPGMGTPERARDDLIKWAKAWRAQRLTAAPSRQEKERLDKLERETRHRLALAVLPWLWHQENPPAVAERAENDRVLVGTLRETTAQMAVQCTAPSSLWQDHSTAVLVAAARITSLSAEVERLQGLLKDAQHAIAWAPFSARRDIEARIRAALSPTPAVEKETE